MDAEHIIIGAGVIGAASAYHLKRNDPDSNVILLDREKRPGSGNTARSAALYRNIFSSSISRKLSNSTIKYFQELGSKIQLRSIGYLWMFSYDQWSDSGQAISSLDPERDDLEFLDSGNIRDILNINTIGKDRFPSIAKGIMGRMCGSLSGMGLAQHYVDEFRKMGGEVHLETEIKKIDLEGKGSRYAPWDRKGIKSLEDGEGNKFTAEKYVFATGAWTHELLSPLGVFTGVLPKKRQLFGIRIDDPGEITNSTELDSIPALILPAGGTYIKPMLDRNLMILGLADGIGQPYDMSDPEFDMEYFEKAIAPVLHHYFYNLTDYEIKMKWTGYYAYHWPDKNPVVENDGNIFWASGASGSGIMKADGIGRVVASKLKGNVFADLHDGSRIRVSDLSLRERNAEMERFVI